MYNFRIRRRRAKALGYLYEGQHPKGTRWPREIIFMNPKDAPVSNKYFYLFRLIAIPLLILVATCFLLAQAFDFLSAFPAPSTLVAHGHYTSAFERSYFQPCDSTEKWDIRDGNLDPIDAFKQSLPQQSYRDQPETVYVEWRGVLTRRGPLGLFGGNFNVQEVLRVRLVDPTDCQ